MADEETVQTENQAPPEADQQQDEAPEAAQLDAAPQEPDTWAKAFPALAGQYNELKPEARERVLLQELERLQSVQVHPTAEATQRTSASEMENDEELPPIPPAPKIDLGALQAQVSRGMTEGDPSAINEALGKMFQYVELKAQRADQLAELAYRAIEEQGADIEDLRVPGIMKQVLGKVRGATEIDTVEAMRIYKAGEATTPEAALKLAVFNRQQAEPVAALKPTASEEARRKARSLQAARGMAEDVGATGVATRIPETPEEMRDMMLREEREKKARTNR